MSNWSSRRKGVIFLISILFLLVLIGLPVFLLFYDTPSCSDKRMNGDETGVDCGGSCQLLCTAESLPVLSKGDPRILAIAPGIYEAIAIFENPNVVGQVNRARYMVKFYSASSTEPVKTVEGETFIPKNSTFAIFVGPMEIADVDLSRATVEWVGDLKWEKNTDDAVKLSVRDPLLTRESTFPRVDAEILNSSLEEARNIEAVAIVYDIDGNIIAASKTFVESLKGGATAPVVFSWPSPFAKESASTNILYKILPDKSFIR